MFKISYDIVNSLTHLKDSAVFRMNDDWEKSLQMVC
jgi:hypothetical protein